MNEQEQIKRRQAMFPVLPLHEAMKQLDHFPDDSTSQQEFLKSLASYMLDKKIELNALSIALAYEERDRALLQTE